MVQKPTMDLNFTQMEMEKNIGKKLSQRLIQL